MLGTYELFLSDLLVKFNEKNTKKKAQKVGGIKIESAVGRRFFL